LFTLGTGLIRSSKLFDLCYKCVLVCVRANILLKSADLTFASSHLASRLPLIVRRRYRDRGRDRDREGVRGKQRHSCSGTRAKETVGMRLEIDTEQSQGGPFHCTAYRLHKTGFRSKSNTCNSQRFTNLVFNINLASRRHAMPDSKSFFAHTECGASSQKYPKFNRFVW